jgi:hypothetical protein
LRRHGPIPVDDSGDPAQAGWRGNFMADRSNDNPQDPVQTSPSSSPSQPQHRPLWPRISAPFTAHRVTAAFTVVLALATLALVVTAYFQHRDAVEAIEATQRLAVATENAAKDRRQTASAELILKIDAMLSEHRYDRISEDIQSHGSDYHLPKYKNRADADVEEYIGVFEDMGYFIKDTLISAKMAYDHFSYDIEKAWCNTVVQETIRKVRANDKSKTAQSDPMYGNFERLAKEYLDAEGQSCIDLDKQ